MLRASEACERAGVPSSSLVCEGFLGQAAATSIGLGMPNLPVATIVGHTGAQSIEEIHAMVLPRAPLDEAELRKHCAERLQRIFIPVRFVAVERIPRNDMAKIERGRLMELLKATVARSGAIKRPGSIRSMSGSSAILGSTTKNVAK